VFTKLSHLRCPEFTPFFTITHNSFKSSLSSNHLVCMPFLNTALSSLSSDVTVHYTTRGQVNCPGKVFFSYLELHLLLSYPLSVHVAFLRGPRVKLACYLVQYQWVYSFPCLSPQPYVALTNTHCCQQKIHFSASQSSRPNSAVFCYNDIWARCSRAGVDLYSLTNTCSSNRFPFPSDTICISSCSSSRWYWNSNGLDRHY
jgi:hypothetical protein